MTILTELEIAGNYLENILIKSFKDENGLYGGCMYMMRNGEILLEELSKTE
jgi:Tfp pilus assembly protein PilZ